FFVSSRRGLPNGRGRRKPGQPEMKSRLDGGSSRLVLKGIFALKTFQLLWIRAQTTSSVDSAWLLGRTSSHMRFFIELEDPTTSRPISHPRTMFPPTSNYCCCCACGGAASKATA